MAMPGILRGWLRRPDVTAPLPGAMPAKPGAATVCEPSLLSLAQSEQAFYQFLFKSGHKEPLSVPQRLVLDSVRDSLQNQVLRQAAIPRLPSVIPRLLQSLRDPDSSSGDYLAIVNKDPALSGAVLKLANSAYFNPSGAPMADIERAIIKLGISGLRSVLSAAVMQPIIQRDSEFFPHTGPRLWLHSINCAVACEVTAETRDLPRFEVYLMGLVHELGKITAFYELCRQHKLNGETRLGRNAFVPLMRAVSAMLSYLIARDWQLPAEVCTALREQTELRAGKVVSPYGQLLYQANMACEVYAVTPSEKRANFGFLLAELDLPADLFNRLDQVSAQS